MFWFKACPRCKGDLSEGTNVYGTYVSGLQCARCLTAEEEGNLKPNALKQDRRSGRAVAQRQAA